MEDIPCLVLTLGSQLSTHHLTPSFHFLLAQHAVCGSSLYRDMSEIFVPFHFSKSGKKQICEQTDCVIDDLLSVAAVMANKRRKQHKTHQKELIQQYLDNGGIPGRYGEDIPDDPRAMKEDDLGI